MGLFSFTNINSRLLIEERPSVLNLEGSSCNAQHIYRPQTKFAKVMFLQVSVCPRGGAEGACVVARGACMVARGHV